jgi:hypothetical protein
MYLDEFPDAQRAKTSVIMYHSIPHTLSHCEVGIRQGGSHVFTEFAVSNV